MRRSFQFQRYELALSYLLCRLTTALKCVLGKTLHLRNMLSARCRIQEARASLHCRYMQYIKYELRTKTTKRHEHFFVF